MSRNHTQATPDQGSETSVDPLNGFENGFDILVLPENMRGKATREALAREDAATPAPSITPDTTTSQSDPLNGWEDGLDRLSFHRNGS